MHFIKDGLRVAEECGHSIYWIELKITEGYVNLVSKKYKAAERCAEKALLGQVQNGGQVKLFGARRCSYLWGEADALHLLGEIYSQQDKSYKQKAIDNLLKAKEIRAKLHDVKLKETVALIKSLENL
jgi:hypothetical protein